MIIRSMKWLACVVIATHGTAYGQFPKLSPSWLSLDSAAQFSSNQNGHASEPYFPELDSGEITRQSLLRPVSFAATLADHHVDDAEMQLAACRCQGKNGSGGSAGSGSGDSGGGASAGDATNPTASITQYQIQNSFIPNTYNASGYGHLLGLLMVKPFETNNKFFPAWITRTTLPVITTADPDGDTPIGPPNDTDFNFGLGRQSGLGDLVFISIFNHPTEWGSWGIGPGFVAPTATRQELGERSWKFSPTFVVVNTSIPTWQLGFLSVYNFPLDGNGTKSLQCQPLIVKQLGQGWYTGWGDDLWSFNTDSGNFAMPLQLRLGKVHKTCGQQFNTFVTGFYTPDELRQGPTPEWGIKLSISLLQAG